MGIMVNNLIIPGILFLSRLALIVHGLNAGNNSNTITSKTPVKCLHIFDDARIHDNLKSGQNYYNISRAIYPSVDVPSLYVKITIQFMNSSDNGCFVTETKKYTWSKACLYVATKYVSLYAMNVYSLGAVWPNKRERELFISLPGFCCNVTEEERTSKMIYFLSTLEDVSIKPEVQDPRLNTAECVVEGHDGFDEDTLHGARKYVMHFYWCSLLFSSFIGFGIARITTVWLANKTKTLKKEEKISLKKGFYLLSVMHSLFEFCLALTALIMACEFGRGGKTIPIIYFSIVLLSFLIGVLLTMVSYCMPGVELRQRYMQVVLTPNYFMIIHHFIWIILGVVTEPGWAITVLFLYCSVLFTIYVFLYHNFKEFCEVDRWDACFFVCVLLLYLGVLFGIVVIGLSFLSTDPVAGIVSSILAVVASLSWRYFKKTFKDETGSQKSKTGENGNEAEAEAMV